MPDRSVVYRLRADITQFKAGMAQASAATRKAADDMTGATKSGAKFRTGLATLGGVAGKVGLVAAAGLGVAIVKAANFDQSMSNVSAATHETAANMELLRAAALKAGADTAFSATEAASGIEALAKAGVSTTDVLAGGLAGALDLAAAGQLEVGAAAEAAASAMTQFNLKGSDVPHIADLLAAAAGKAQGEVSDMAQALNQSGLVAAQMGVSIEETTGSLAAFASAGLIGSDAGTSLKTMLLRLANPSAEAAQAMERFGISAYDAQGNMRPMVEIAGQLQTAFKGQDQATRDAALATIFGSDAIRAANVLYTQGATGIQGWIDKVNDQGYAADTAAIKLDNLKGDLEAFGGSLETALIGTGSGSQGPLRSLVQNLTDVTNAYNNLPQGAKSATAGTLGFIAAAGGGIFVFSKLVQGVASTRLAMDQLGITSSITGRQLGLIATKAAGIAAVGMAVGALADDIGRIDPSKINRSLDALQRGEVTDTVKDLVENMASLSSWTNKIDLGEVVTLFGMFGDSTLDKQAKNIAEVDSALASMVEGGNIDKASSLIDDLAKEADKQGVSFDALIDRFPEYETAMRNAGVATTTGSAAFMAATSASAGLASGTNGLASATGAAAAGMDGVTGSTDAAKKAAEEFKATIDSLNAVLSGRASLRDYEAALDDFTASLKENGRSFDINTEKGRNNQAALDNIASSALKVAENMSEVDRQKFLSNAIGDIRALGEQMNVPKAQIRALIRLLRQANDTDAEPTVEEQGAELSRKRIRAMRAEIALIRSKIVNMDEKGAAQARARIALLRAEINRLKGKTVTINYHGIRTGAGAGGAAPPPGQGQTQGAEGMTVPGVRHPYGDKIPLLAAPGEEVISNRYGQADRNRALLKAINANRYAGGGTVGRAVTAAPSVSVAAPRVNVGGTTVTVLIDGQEFRGMIVNEIEGRDEMAGMRGRAGG